MPLVKHDPWLEPVADDVKNRYLRYETRLKEINKNFGSLKKFADAYNYYGINYDKNARGWFYREWAPKANALFLMGDFNDWNRRSHPLTCNEYGVWEIFLPEALYKDKFKHGSLFKVLINGGNVWRERLPAYIKRVIQDDNTKDFAAQLWIPEKEFDWENDKYKFPKDEQLLIYECHIGMAQEKEGIGTYNEFTDIILPKIKQLGYNAIQIMAIAEHPYYGSFGYHVSNFFAPSSRFGTPEELKELIKTAHKLGIAVIMDIVHSHTVKNINEGLNMFDGSEDQYFHTGDRGNHPSWDSKLFDYGKIEVMQFLLSNLKYWMEEFHFDGFRFDGVTSMLYFHHGYIDSFDQYKFFRDGVEMDAITYLQLANKLIHTLNKNAISIAEDVSGMPGLTAPIEDGGIGFDYRLGMGIPDFWIKLLKEYKDDDWNMEQIWNVMNDRLPDVKTIAYAESHDQALVGDKTIAFWLMDKEMYFSMSKLKQNLIVDRGIALHKMIRLFTLVNGGQAYMNFMGNEFGHPEWVDFPREGNNWSYKHARRQWSLVDDELLRYHYLYDFDAAMIHLARKYNIMGDLYGEKLNVDNTNNTIVFKKAGLIFVFNFHPTISIPDYEFYIPEKGVYKIALNSDDEQYGGFGRIDSSKEFHAIKHEDHYRLKIYNVNRTVQVFEKVRD